MKPMLALGLASMLALGLASCIDPPTLKSCAEFPLGTAGCPSPCVLFCDLMVDNCKETLGQTGGDAQESCVAACDEGLRTRGTVGDLEGNTLDCRVTHARLAATEPAHCAAAAIEGIDGCVDRTCELYCAQMAKTCRSVFADDEQACLRTCKTYPDDPALDLATSNTVECRTYFARLAGLETSEDHCQSAASSGGKQCGSPCAAYCDQVMANCSGDAPVYASREVCENVCKYLPDGGGSSDHLTEINTLQCRIYHAGAPSAVDPAKHCPHAMIYNAAHCGPICGTYCGLMIKHCPGTYAPRGGETACTTDCAALLESNTPLYPLGNSTVECLP